MGTIFDNYNFVTYRPDYVPETWVINSFDSKDLRAAPILTVWQKKVHGSINIIVHLLSVLLRVVAY